jgi:hypothetical protein
VKLDENRVRTTSSKAIDTHGYALRAARRVPAARGVTRHVVPDVETYSFSPGG